MGMRMGAGYKASANLETSVANQEILPSPPSGWTVKYQYYKLNLINNQDCHILINNDTDAKFIPLGQGLEITEVDLPIFSLKIVENGITFNWFGAYQ